VAGKALVQITEFKGLNTNAARGHAQPVVLNNVQTNVGRMIFARAEPQSKDAPRENGKDRQPDVPDPTPARS